MSFQTTLLLGAFAGLTIFAGLPLARIRLLDTRSRVALAMFAVGVLVFLLVDVLGHAFETVEEAVEEFGEGEAGAGEALGLPALLITGFAVGSVGLAAVEQRLRRGRTRPPIAGGAVDVLLAAPPAVTVEHETARARSAALSAGMTIAAAVGMHNFGEGLAMGVASSSGEVSLATALMVGFALHNATEGFGIVGPLGAIRPSWKWLLGAGLVAGGPTVLGTAVGYSVDSEPLELAFYACAGGAIVYAIGEVWAAMRRYGHRVLGLALLAAGLSVGLLTELVVEYGGV